MGVLLSIRKENSMETLPNELKSYRNNLLGQRGKKKGRTPPGKERPNGENITTEAKYHREVLVHQEVEEKQFHLWSTTTSG